MFLSNAEEKEMVFLFVCFLIDKEIIYKEKSQNCHFCVTLLQKFGLIQASG